MEIIRLRQSINVVTVIDRGKTTANNRNRNKLKSIVVVVIEHKIRRLCSAHLFVETRQFVHETLEYAILILA